MYSFIMQYINELSNPYMNDMGYQIHLYIMIT